MGYRRNTAPPVMKTELERKMQNTGPESSSAFSIVFKDKQYIWYSSCCNKKEITVYKTGHVKLC